MVEAFSSNELPEGSICMTLRTLALNAFVVRIFVAGHTIIVSDVCKLLELFVILYADLVAFLTFNSNMLAGKSEFGLVVVELRGRPECFGIMTGDAI
ncbi:MAG: hypothetical protein C0490_09510 [Marivirga sp.]|nr:hypothetical protein [Marivirga sp.]